MLIYDIFLLQILKKKNNNNRENGLELNAVFMSSINFHHCKMNINSLLNPFLIARRSDFQKKNKNKNKNCLHIKRESSCEK